MFKKLVSFVTGKVETAIEQNTSPEEAWRSAARILIKEIDRLQHTRVSNNLEVTVRKAVMQRVNTQFPDIIDEAIRERLFGEKA